MPEQLSLTLEAARERGAVLAEKALEKAERVADFDTEGARRFVVNHLAFHGQMSGEELVDAAKEHGFRPEEDRAFGAVFGALSRQGVIRCVGYCLRAKGNGTAGGRTWALNR